MIYVLPKLNFKINNKFESVDQKLCNCVALTTLYSVYVEDCKHESNQARR